MSTILIEKNIMVPMRDGVKLATDIYRLEGVTSLPVLLARTPYDKEQIVTAGDIFSVLRAVQAGYVVVVQDVRGRYASEGHFRPHVQETEDGFDTIAWASAQPWSNGKVGMFGGSYLAQSQWLPARDQPPALRAIVPSVSPSDAYEGCMYQGGAKVLHDLMWVVGAIVPLWRSLPAASAWFPGPVPALFLLLAPLTLVSGASFPVAASLCARDIRAVGRGVGSVYLWNTLGAAAGSAAAGLLLLPRFGIAHSFLICVVMNLAAGVALMLALPADSLARRLRPALAWAAVAAALRIVSSVTFFFSPNPTSITRRAPILSSP